MIFNLIQGRRAKLKTSLWHILLKGNMGSISPTFYPQLLHAIDPKRQSSHQSFCAFGIYALKRAIAIKVENSKADTFFFFWGGGNKADLFF